MRLVLVAGLAIGWPGTGALAAQSQAGGRVVRVAQGDTVPVGPIDIVLHRIGSAAQGPVDTVHSNSQGRFAVRFRADTGSVYLLSVRYQGIEYFSQPLSPDRTRPDPALLVIVADTSSTTPVEVAERTLLISRPDQSGSRTVIDWMVLSNPGEHTRVAGDSTNPSWSAPLPAAVQNVALADVHRSQFSPDAIEFRRDSALVFAPISPGRKELVLQYRLPRSERKLTVSLQVADSLFVLLEESAARIERPALTPLGAQEVETRSFQRWAGPIRGAGMLEISFPSGGIAAGAVLPVLVAMVLLGFAWLGWVAVRARASRPAGGGGGSTPHPVALADVIARLDQRHQEGAASMTPVEEEQYRVERARLKAALERALARAPRRS